MDSVNMVDLVHGTDSENSRSPNHMPCPGFSATAVAPTDPGKRKKDYTSRAWQYFKLIKIDDKQWAQCLTCPKKYAYGNSGYGTRNLLRHVDENKCEGLKNKNVGEMLLNRNVTLRSKRLDQAVFRDKMAIAIMMHNYPFSIVEHVGFRDMLAYLNPEVKCYCRNTAKADVLKIYRREKDAIKLSMHSVPGRICLTSDIWSSITSEGYLSLTAHFVDPNWVLQSRILNFQHFPPPHTGVAIYEQILEFLKSWEIENKVFTITVDNASTNDCMQDYLKGYLANNLLCRGEFFHVRCCAHILNIIVQTGLAIDNELLQKVRESVKHVKASEARLRKFTAACAQVGINVQMGLRLDCITRWNSTWKMLKSVILYQKAFVRYAEMEPEYRKHCPTVEQWERVKKLAMFLQPFDELTTLISGSNYPTANLYFKCVFNIQMVMLKEAESEDPLIKKMVAEMKPKFDKYWEDYCLILSMAVTFDPCNNIHFVRYCFEKLDSNTANEKVEKVLKVLSGLRRVFQEYVDKYSIANPTENQNQASTQASENETPRGLDDTSLFRDETIDFYNYDYEDENSATPSELEAYLKHKRYKQTDMDVLKHWQVQSQGAYPILSLMARDFLSIPITSVASESAFSIGAKVLTKFRSSLLPENAEALICDRNWLCGYKVESDEPSEEDLHIKLSTTTESRGSSSSITTINHL